MTDTYEVKQYSVGEKFFRWIDLSPATKAYWGRDEMGRIIQ